MKVYRNMSLARSIENIRKDFISGYPKDRVDVGELHSKDVSGVPQLISHELENVVIEGFMPYSRDSLAREVKPQLPWAENHFQERVSGLPLNPPPSASYWHKPGQADEHLMADGKYSHTYPERFWPKEAGIAPEDAPMQRQGIRFEYGDLQDVVELLIRSPFTRQAYLPVWFPEDTGNVMGERVPCTLGYHFLRRGNLLNLTYFMRSCDYVRFFRDDIYMACRLAQWMLQQVQMHVKWWDSVEVSVFSMHISSLHVFEGDFPALRRLDDDET